MYCRISDLWRNYCWSVHFTFAPSYVPILGLCNIFHLLWKCIKSLTFQWNNSWVWKCKNISGNWFMNVKPIYRAENWKNLGKKWIDLQSHLYQSMSQNSNFQKLHWYLNELWKDKLKQWLKFIDPFLSLPCRYLTEMQSKFLNYDPFLLMHSDEFVEIF